MLIICIDSYSDGGSGGDAAPDEIGSLTSLLEDDLMIPCRLPPPVAAGLPIIIGSLIRKARLLLDLVSEAAL